MFEPGDFIECVNVTPRGNPNTGAPPTPENIAHIALLRLGRIYTVRGLIHGYDMPGVLLREVIGQPEWNGWAGFRFRRVYRPDPKLIELLQHAPSPELEPA